MSARSVLMAVAGLFIAGGCAGIRSAQEVQRLKSDIGLLDQRVSQLERASLREPSQAQWPAEGQLPAPVAGVRAPAAAASAASAASTVKPSKTEIQQALKNAGFYQGPLDGKIGPLTREAVRTFQQIHSLKADGVVGKQTWEKLFPYLDVSAPPPGDVSAAETIK